MGRACDTRILQHHSPPAKTYANEGAPVLFLKGESVCEVSYGDRKGKYMGQRGVTLPRVEKQSA